MTTEYRCAALTHDNQTVELMTCGAPLVDQALADFRAYIEADGKQWETLQELTLTAVDAEADPLTELREIVTEWPHSIEQAQAIADKVESMSANWRAGVPSFTINGFTEADWQQPLDASDFLRLAPGKRVYDGDIALLVQVLSYVSNASHKYLAPCCLLPSLRLLVARLTS